MDKTIWNIKQYPIIYTKVFTFLPLSYFFLQSTNIYIIPYNSTNNIINLLIFKNFKKFKKQTNNGYLFTRSVSCKLYLLLFRTCVQLKIFQKFFKSPTSLRDCSRKSPTFLQDRSRKDITYYYCDLGLTICLNFLQLQVPTIYEIALVSTVLFVTFADNILVKKCFIMVLLHEWCAVLGISLRYCSWQDYPA